MRERQWRRSWWRRWERWRQWGDGGDEDIEEEEVKEEDEDFEEEEEDRLAQEKTKAEVKEETFEGAGKKKHLALGPGFRPRGPDYFSVWPAGPYFQEGNMDFSAFDFLRGRFSG